MAMLEVNRAQKYTTTQLSFLGSREASCSGTSWLNSSSSQEGRSITVTLRDDTSWT